MATISETADAFRARARRGLSSDEVRRLSVLSPLRSTLSLLHTWGFIGALVVIACRWSHPLIVTLAVVCLAVQQHALAILTHQSAHYRMYKARWLNDLVGKICGAPLGVSMLTYRIIHRIHHNHLYSVIDPDLALMAGYPRGRAYLAKKLVKDLVGLTTIKNYLYFFGRQAPSDHETPRGGPSPLDDTSDALRSAARRERTIVVAINVVFVACLVWTGAWKSYLLLWALPAATIFQVLLRLRAVCEHGAPRDTSGDPLRSARTTIASPLARWLVFPHNMQFHIEHHLYPSVPHYRLPECHKRLEATGILENADVLPSLALTLRKVFGP